MLSWGSHVCQVPEHCWRSCVQTSFHRPARRAWKQSCLGIESHGKAQQHGSICAAFVGLHGTVAQLTCAIKPQTKYTSSQIF